MGRNGFEMAAPGLQTILPGCANIMVPPCTKGIKLNGTGKVTNRLCQVVNVP